MGVLDQGEWVTALVAFTSVLLATVSVVLAWEAFRRWKEQRAVARGIAKLTGTGNGGERSQTDDLWVEEGAAGPAWLQALLTRMPRGDKLERLLEQADVSWTVHSFLTLSLGLMAASGLAVSVVVSSRIGALGAGVGAALLPLVYVLRRRKKRLEAFERQFPQAIDLLGRSMRAGHALPTGLRLIATETEDPVAEEFRLVYEEQKFGLPLSESLAALADRIDLVDARIFATSLLIQREVGGNLAEILSNLSSLIRTRFKLRRQLKVHTAQGRLTGYVLAALPVGLGAALYMISAEHMGVLFSDPMGHALLVIAVILQILGFFVIRRILDLEI